MKRIMASFVLITSVQLIAVPAGMIINRSGQAMTVAYSGASGALFSTGAISVTGDAAHTTDQMILIPLTSIVKPGSSPAANYQASAVSAVVTIGSASVNIPSFAANTSYVIAPGTSSGTFVANPGLITYDTVTGVGAAGSPSPVVPGAGF